MKEPNELIGQSEAAELLAVSSRTLEMWRFRGCGPAHIRLSKRAIRYRRSDIHAWIESRLVQSTSEPIDGDA